MWSSRRVGMLTAVVEGPHCGRLARAYHCGNQAVLREANLTKGTFVRRDVLEMMAAAGATGLPAVGTLWPGTAHAAGAPAYDPAARFDLAVSDVELRRNSAGRMLMARIYQPDRKSTRLNSSH